MTHRFGIKRIKSNHQDDVILAKRSRFENFKEEKCDRLHELNTAPSGTKNYKSNSGLTFDSDNKFKI